MNIIKSFKLALSFLSPSFLIESYEIVKGAYLKFEKYLFWLFIAYFSVGFLLLLQIYFTANWFQKVSLYLMGLKFLIEHLIYFLILIFASYKYFGKSRGFFAYLIIFIALIISLYFANFAIAYIANFISKIFCKICLSGSSILEKLCYISVIAKYAKVFIPIILLSTPVMVFFIMELVGPKICFKKFLWPYKNYFTCLSILALFGLLLFCVNYLISSFLYSIFAKKLALGLYTILEILVSILLNIFMVAEFANFYAKPENFGEQNSKLN